MTRPASSTSSHSDPSIPYPSIPYPYTPYLPIPTHRYDKACAVAVVAVLVLSEHLEAAVPWNAPSIHPALRWFDPGQGQRTRIIGDNAGGRVINAFVLAEHLEAAIPRNIPRTYMDAAESRWQWEWEREWWLEVYAPAPLPEHIPTTLPL
jgi:hypothetical protein